MCSRFEEKRTAEEGTFGDNNDTTSLLGSQVNDRLYFFRLQEGTVIDCTVVGDPLFSSQCLYIDNVVLSEPIGNRSSVGKLFLTEGL